MANSFSFNGIDMLAYGVIVTSHNIPDCNKEIPTVQLKDRAYSGEAKRGVKRLRLTCSIDGSDVSDVRDKLDDVIRLIDVGNCRLVVDGTGRYFNAEFEDRSSGNCFPTYWQGTLTFLCPDPLAYSTTETSSDFNIDADPDTVSETVGGTAIVKPVWTLTAGEDLTDVTIKLENQTTGEELQWTGSLVDEDELEIDSANWTVKKNGTSAMTITGEFPRLIAGSNTIKVTGLSTTGTLNITYRDAYL
jgi:phage-related protein